MEFLGHPAAPAGRTAHGAGMTLNRRPAGIPTGGQFAPTAHEESDLALEAPGGYGPEVPRDELLGVISDKVRFWAFRQGVPFAGQDDLIQDVAVEVLGAREGSVVTEQFVHAVARRVVTRSVGHVRLSPVNRAAMKQFSRAVADRESVLGRALSEREMDVLAAAIREGWHDQAHRPSPDFRAQAARSTTVVLDPAVHDVPAPFDVESEALGGDGEVGPALAAAVAAMDAGATREELARMYWNITAESGGAPAARAGSVSKRQFTRARAMMAARPGGVMGAVRQWERGEVDASTEMLFYPFGRLDEGGRDEVCRLLRENPARAADLWSSALAFASTAHSPTR